MWNPHIYGNLLVNTDKYSGYRPLLKNDSAVVLQNVPELLKSNFESLVFQSGLLVESDVGTSLIQLLSGKFGGGRSVPAD